MGGGYRQPRAVALIAVVLLACPVALLAATAPPAAFPVLEFSEFGLSMSADDLRDWARARDFVEIAGVEPGQQAWQRVHANGFRQLIQFIPGDGGLDQLILTQENVVGTANALARQIVSRYGEPSLTEHVDNGVRLTYPYQHHVPARRVFITGPYRLTMGLITEAQLAAAERAAAAPPRPSTAPQAAGSMSALAAVPGWARMAAAISAVLALLAAVVMLLPARLGGPVRRWLIDLFQALLGFLGYTTMSLFTMAMGILIYPMLTVSGCGAGVFALEQGTSWMWLLPWLLGVVFTTRANEGDGVRDLVLANLLYLLALVGPVLELGWG